jgi:N-dimethylarginine dimethylaminohydrolase
MNQATTPAYKAQVASTFHNGRVEHTTYINAKNEAEARAKLDREGYEVLSVRAVQLTHLGGEITQ